MSAEVQFTLPSLHFLCCPTEQPTTAQADYGSRPHGAQVKMAAGPIPCIAPGPSVSGGHPAVVREARALIVCHGCREWAGQRLGQEGGRRASQQDPQPGTGRAAAQTQPQRWGPQLKSSTQGKEGQPWLRFLLTFFTVAFSRVTSCAPSWP